MRIRATVAVVSGALALSALAIPASQASPSRGDLPSNDRYGFSAEQLAGLPKANQRALTVARNVIAGSRDPRSCST